MAQNKVTDDLQALLGVLPAHITQSVLQEDDNDNLLEVILDLGRVPTARFIDREVILSQVVVTKADIDFVTGRISEFDSDNRAVKCDERKKKILEEAL